MKIKLLKDRFTLWVLCGITGAICREITGLVLKWTGLTNGLHIVNIAADLYTNDLKEIFSVAGVIAGILTDWGLGATLGIVIGYTLIIYGNQNYLLKGLAIGLLAWIGLYGFLVHGVPQMFILKLGIKVSCCSLINHCIYGGITAFLIHKFTALYSDWR